VLVVNWIAVFVFEEYAILNGDRRQFAGPNSQKSLRTPGFCRVVKDSERSTLALGRPESDFCWMQVVLPTLRSHGVPEQGLILPAL
jgi:hypothetical protein